MVALDTAVSGMHQAKKGENALCGPPTSWVSPIHSLVPPSHSPSPDPSSSENEPPTPLWKGKGPWLGSRIKRARVLVVELTSLNRGEGLIYGLLCVVEGAEVVEE